MNAIYVLILCVGGGPFAAAINQSVPSLPLPGPDANWRTVTVDSTVIDLPVLTPARYTRTAPANYVMPMPSKMVAVPCPQHGYRCGMQRVIEDLLGHLQTVHGMTLEQANEIGREKWQSYHDDLHWCDETAERQELYLHPQPQPAKPKFACAGGNCPTRNYSLPNRRLFR